MAVITDSTASIPASLLPEDVRVVPLLVQVGARTVADDGSLPAAELIAAMKARQSVITSRPAPSLLAAAYRDALSAGAERVVSVHISAELSGTWDSARLAAQEFDYGQVRVVDSRSTAMGLGFAVLAAAAAAADGADAGAVQDAAVAVVDRTACLFYVDNLDALRRGGRISASQAMLGTALSVKPLLHVQNGRIRPLEKVRTAGRAIARLLDLAVTAAGDGAVEIAVQHLGARARAEEIAAALTQRLPAARVVETSEVGAAVGAHTGPGTVGVIIRRP